VSRRARATIALLAIAACARTPAAPTSAAAPAPVVWRDENRNLVTDVVFGDDVVYALTQDRRLRAWTGDAQPVRTLSLAPVFALAADGSVAATKTKDGEDSDRLDLWALPALTRVRTRSFKHGIDMVLAVSPAAAYLRLNFHNHGHRDDGAVMAMPPPLFSDAFWNFAADTVIENRSYPCDPPGVLPGMFMFSGDARRFACTDGWDVEWIDLPSDDRARPDLAADWRPPPATPTNELNFTGTKPRGRGAPPPHSVLSLRLRPDGRDVYVTYRRDEVEGGGWRLERWTPGKAGDPGQLTRLAATNTAAFTKVLAISGDGSLAVLGSWREPLVVRRAPRYEAQPLAAEAATAAAVSSDGQRIASGHLDGTLRLWDARTGRLIATAGP